MFCRHCGQQLSPGSVFCTHCGVAMGTGNNFCYNCGAKTDPIAVICVGCGAPLQQQQVNSFPEQKSRVAAGVLGILLGSLGVHNFYLGYTSKALTQLLITILSCGVLSFAMGIWGLIEGIQILTGSINVDANGVPLRD